MNDLAEHTIFATLGGSHAYGTATSRSDIDVRGVCIVPLSRRVSLRSPFEQNEGPLPDDLSGILEQRLAKICGDIGATAAKTEAVIFDVAKFLTLLTAANPGALEILFCDERDWLLVTPEWTRIHEHRHRFLTQRVRQTFLGYAMAQMKKIETHRSWLLNPPERKPRPEDFGLVPHRKKASEDERNRLEQAIARKLRSYAVDDVEMPIASRIAVRERMEAFYRDVLASDDAPLDEQMHATAAVSLGLSPGLVHALKAENRYHMAMKKWEAYQSWSLHRNADRAALEREHGYDTKHGMHLIRLMRMGLEALTEGDLRVRRDDASELLEIRRGGLSYECLVKEAVRLQHAMDAAGAKCTLPAEVDTAWVDQLLFELACSPLLVTCRCRVVHRVRR